MQADRTDNVVKILTSDGMDVSGYNLVHLGGERVVSIPILRGIEDGNCARYARKVSNGVFGRRYTQKVDYDNGEGKGFPDAWDYRHVYRTRDIPNGNSGAFRTAFMEMFENGTLTGGELVGIFNPNSSSIGRFDMKRLIVPYTHLASLVGMSEDRRVFFAEQLVDRIQVVELSDILERKHKPRQIIFDEPLVG